MAKTERPPLPVGFFSPKIDPMRSNIAARVLCSMGTWMPRHTLEENGNPQESFEAADLNTDTAMRNRAKWAIRQADILLAELSKFGNKQLDDEKDDFDAF